jgi:hypothetical protein
MDEKYVLDVEVRNLRIAIALEADQSRKSRRAAAGDAFVYLLREMIPAKNNLANPDRW